jgi:hypothetical protein
VQQHASAAGSLYNSPDFRAATVGSWEQAMPINGVAKAPSSLEEEDALVVVVTPNKHSSDGQRLLPSSYTYSTTSDPGENAPAAAGRDRDVTIPSYEHVRVVTPAPNPKVGSPLHLGGGADDANAEASVPSAKSLSAGLTTAAKPTPTTAVAAGVEVPEPVLAQSTLAPAAVQAPEPVLAQSTLAPAAAVQAPEPVFAARVSATVEHPPKPHSVPTPVRTSSSLHQLGSRVRPRDDNGATVDVLASGAALSSSSSSSASASVSILAAGLSCNSPAKRAKMMESNGPENPAAPNTTASTSTSIAATDAVAVAAPVAMDTSRLSGQPSAVAAPHATTAR